MAIVTTHVLNAVDGTHANGIAVSLRCLDPETEVARGVTDEGGRLVLDVDVTNISPTSNFELVFATGDYWSTFLNSCPDKQIIAEVVLRFRMPEPSGKYHRPIIISPNGYSTWMSGD